MSKARNLSKLLDSNGDVVLAALDNAPDPDLSPYALLTDLLPSGTKLTFNQTNAPTGWTKETIHNDKALRVVSGAVGSGGSTAFSTAMGTPSVSGIVGISGSPAVGNLAVSMSGNISGTTLSISTIPSHRHDTRRDTSGGFVGNAGNGLQNYSWRNTGSFTGNASPVFSEGGSGSHNHGHNLSGTLNGAPSVGNLAGSLSSATAAINVQYVDIIIASKD